MILSSRKLVGAVAVLGAVAGVIVACGSEPDSKFVDPNAPVGTFTNDAGLITSNKGDDPNGDLFKDDPPPNYCGVDAGVQVTKIGGTVECPDDKNKPGCGCPNVGDKAKCWTGLRKNRGLGGCKDGETICERKGENDFRWGQCLGQVLPRPNAIGEAACSCFSVGLWKIANTAPCIWSDSAGYYAYSTIGPDASGCTETDHLDRGVKPSKGVWSTDTLKTDCTGTFTLVYRVKVGDYKNPKKEDCTLGESSTLVEYRQENVEQSLPDLPHWNTADSACVKKWEVDTPEDQSPGYGEMIVRGGKTALCDVLADEADPSSEFVFNRVLYCPKICRKPENKELPVCKECQLKGQGDF